MADPSYRCGSLVTFAIILGGNFFVNMMMSNRLRLKKPKPINQTNKNNKQTNWSKQTLEGEGAFNSVHNTFKGSANIYKF